MEPEPFYKNVRMLAAVAGAVALLVLGVYYFLVIKKAGELASSMPTIDVGTVTSERGEGTPSAEELALGVASSTPLAKNLEQKVQALTADDLAKLGTSAFMEQPLEPSVATETIPLAP